MQYEQDIDYAELKQILSKVQTRKELSSNIVNAPFAKDPTQSAFLFLGIMVLLEVDKKSQTVKRIALSDTAIARLTTDVSPKPFEQIVIPLNEPKNIITKAIRTGQPQSTTDWKDLFVPALKTAEARINQANAGIGYSAVYPYSANDGGALIYSYYQYRDMISDMQKDFMTKYTEIVNESLSKFSS